MRKLVSVVIVALVIAACEQGPGTQEPESELGYPIEGTWGVTEVIGSYQEPGRRTPVDWQMSFIDGMYEHDTGTTRYLGTYFVDEKSRSLVVLEQYITGNRIGTSSASVNVYRYEMDGADRATLRTRGSYTGNESTATFPLTLKLERIPN